MKYIISRTSGYAPHDDAKEIELVYEEEERLLKWDEEAGKRRGNFQEIKKMYKSALDKFLANHRDVREDENYYIGITEKRTAIYVIDIDNIHEFIRQLDERIILSCEDGGEYSQAIRRYLEENGIEYSIEIYDDYRE